MEAGPSEAGGAGKADEALIAKAIEVMEHAYSPYSGVRVGAALRAQDGRVFTGCNVENASYGLTICAERSALVQAISAGARSFDAIAITTNLSEPLAPCGACRQMLREFGDPLRVLCAGRGGGRFEASLAELLPRAFGPASLEGERNERPPR